MAKPRGQTLQQKLGFSDPELTTPKHDELMIWLDRWLDTNCACLIASVGHKVSDDVIVDEGAYHPDRTRSPAKFVSEFNVAIPDVPYRTYVPRKTWEYPITDRSYTIGFADMKCSVRTDGRIYYSPTTGEFSRENYECVFFFEVKPTIPSLGEVIRQIRMYQTYTREYSVISGWFIVSPDDRYKDYIVDQRIGFIAAPTN